MTRPAQTTSNTTRQPPIKTTAQGEDPSGLMDKQFQACLASGMFDTPSTFGPYIRWGFKVIVDIGKSDNFFPQLENCRRKERFCARLTIVRRHGNSTTLWLMRKSKSLT
ncbi:hypothetical protein Droror1_Dr00008545 [Drosera rotundifolia]